MPGMYDRQDRAGVKIPNKVIVVGIGGVGAWVSLWSAMAGVKNITMCDSDLVESHNLPRIPLSTSDVGRPKTEAMKDLILRLRPDTYVECLPNIDEYNKSALFSMYDKNYDGNMVLVDCTDDPKIQRMLARETPFRYIRAGCDVDSATVINREDVLNTFAIDEEADNGYSGIPSYVGPAALAAAIAVVQMFWKQVYIISLRGGIRVG